MNPTIADLLWPAFRPRRAAWMAGVVLALVVCVWTVISAIDVAINGYDGGIYVPQSECPDGAPDQPTCVRRYQEREREERTEAAVQGRLLVATVPLGVALICAALWWRVRNKDVPAVTRLLVSAPDEAVWLYGNTVRYVKHGRELTRENGLAIGTIRHRFYLLKMSEQDVARAMAGLQAHLPHATFGFSPAHQGAFQRDPASLRRSGHAAAPQPAGSAAAGQPAAQPGASAPWVAIAPQVTFAQIDHVMRSLGLTPEGIGPLVAPGEPGGAAWSAPLARVVYRLDASTQTRAIQLFAHDPVGLHRHIAATGLPVAPYHAMG